MRLAVTADLHLPITSFARIAALFQEIASYRPDAIALAGDIGESVADIEACLLLFRKLNCPVLVIAGNHDLWCHAVPSQRLWEEVLPDLAQRTGCRWLEGNAFVHGAAAVIGTIAWYDYSAADPAIRATAHEFARDKRFFNNDALLINWPWSDIEFSRRVADPFLATLDRLQTDATVEQIIVVTHVPVLECQMCRKPHDRDWAFSNAYFGNLTLGSRIVSYSKVTHVISGHTHVGREGTMSLADGGTVHARVLASDYRRPVWLGLEV